jgi:serine-type D-Ala-D-Ala carboxypeptidase
MPEPALQPVLDRLLGRFVAEGHAPQVAAAVLHHGQVVFAGGSDFSFDTASLTKPLVTAAAAQRLFAAGRLDPNEPLGDALATAGFGFASGHMGSPSSAPMRAVLEHRAGIAAWKPLFQLRQPGGANRASATPGPALDAIVHAVMTAMPVAEPTYSDLGPIVLAALFEALAGPHWHGLSASQLHPAPEATAPTEYRLELARTLGGEVHDDNAFALTVGHPNRVAGHAGLFATALDTAHLASAAIALTPLRAPQSTARFHWGWDTPTGAATTAGPGVPSDTIGHLGFTGTAVWASPSRGLVAVLLTNRVSPWRRPVAPLNDLRRAFFGEVWARC